MTVIWWDQLRGRLERAWWGGRRSRLPAGGVIVLRERRRRDVRGAEAMLARVREIDGDGVDPGARLSPPGLHRAWVAVLDGEVVAHAAVVDARPDDPVVLAHPGLVQGRSSVAAWDRSGVVVCHHVVVHPAFRRRGIGSTLFRRVVPTEVDAVLVAIPDDPGARGVFAGARRWEHPGESRWFPFDPRPGYGDPGATYASYVPWSV